MNAAHRSKTEAWNRRLDWYDLVDSTWALTKTSETRFAAPMRTDGNAGPKVLIAVSPLGAKREFHDVAEKSWAPPARRLVPGNHRNPWRVQRPGSQARGT